MDFKSVFTIYTIFLICSIAFTEAQTNDTAERLSKFALDFYAQCAESKPTGNIIVSPLSISSALTLLSQATNGSTFDELSKGLHSNENKTVAANQYHEFYGQIQKSIGGSTLSIANQIFVQKGRKIKKDFHEVAVDKFMSAVESLNFADSDDSANVINQFVENRTNNKIKELIKPELINTDTQIMLVNAIYFKGIWKHKFIENRTVRGDFFLNDTEKVATHFMNIEADFNYAYLNDLNATALEMKYDNSNFSFVIILPNSRNGLTKLESKLKEHDLNKMFDHMHLKKVLVTIPKFVVEFEINLNEILKNLGMVKMFTEDADLSGLLESGEPLRVSDVVHKAYIEVNEEGSEVAAATGTAIVTRFGGDINFFYADHPFVYFIWDSQVKTPIFSGRLAKLG